MANPVFNVVENQLDNERIIDESTVMTVNGTVQLTALLGVILVMSAAFTWSRYALGYSDQLAMLTGIGFIGALVTSLIIIFARVTMLVPVYTICEGLLLGGISASFESAYPGIVIQAIAGTFAALFSMLILYRTGVIACTDRFRSVIFISTLAIGLLYLIDIVGGLFGYSIPVISSSSTFGILFSLVVVAIAALNLIIDFDFVVQGAQRMLPKKYEWIGAFGLMVTIVWLYIEILRLMAKMRSRN